MLSYLLVALAALAGIALAAPITRPASIARHFPIAAAGTPAVTCGIDSYDFSSLTANGDWVGLDENYQEIYYLNLCHTVQNLWCTLNANTAAVQLCQVNAGDTSSTFAIMNGDTSATKWAYVNGKNADQGIQFTSATGDKCPNGQPRIGVGKLVCGNSTGVIAAVTESPQCTYNVLLPTEKLCTATSERYDLSADYVARVHRALAAKKE